MLPYIYFYNHMTVSCVLKTFFRKPNHSFDENGWNSLKINNPKNFEYTVYGNLL